MKQVEGDEKIERKWKGRGTISKKTKETEKDRRQKIKEEMEMNKEKRVLSQEAS